MAAFWGRWRGGDECLSFERLLGFWAAASLALER